MGWLKRAAKFSLLTLGLASAYTIFHTSPALTPVGLLPWGKVLTVPDTSKPDGSARRDRPPLLQTQDRSTSPQSKAAAAWAVVERPTPLRHRMQAFNAHSTIEATAEETWEQALDLAGEAVRLGKRPNLTLDHLERIHALWQQAMVTLQSIPSESKRYADAQRKLHDYEPNLAEIRYRFDTVRSHFLLDVVNRAGVASSRVRITVCQVSTQACRRLNGKVPPASPASLIKVPIAITALQKVADEGLILDAPLSVKPGNYTEDGSDIQAGATYSLRRVLERMIIHSSNIATNEIIDFMGGFDPINQILRDRGYTQTVVGNKLVGDRTIPWPAVGKRRTNILTTDELTAMMVQVYRAERPSDLVLMNFLLKQRDRELGYAALANLNPEVIWAGEKTGQNSRVLGTTVATKIRDEHYIITVTLDHSHNAIALRQIIREIAAHILAVGHL
ncbi:MAG: serine hydrolase [Synechococcales bacterium]|nr:serine hydrolase [Synechococcales bacterium]